jgi:PAS domain S-box-containing protein
MFPLFTCDETTVGWRLGRHSRPVAERDQSIMDSGAERGAYCHMEGLAKRAAVRSDLVAVADTIPAVVWGAGQDGSIVFLNQRWWEYTGQQVGQAHANAWHSAIHPDDLAPFFERWRSIIVSGEPAETEVRFRRFDGEYRWFLIRALPVRDVRGAVIRWHGINVDINDQTLEHQRLRESLTRALDEVKTSEHRLRAIMDAIPTIAWRALPDGSEGVWNKRWHDYTGLSAGAVRSAGWQTVIHPDDVDRITKGWYANLADGQPGEREGRLRRFDGEYRWFLFRVHPLRDETGSIVQWYGTNTDIDDRKRAEALLAGEKLLLEMVARGHPMPDILQAICRLVESTASGCYCSVVLVDPTGSRLQHGAAPSLPPSFVASIVGRAVNEESGPNAMAAYLNEQVIAKDLSTETRWAASEWCAMALAHGLRTCWSTPIASSGGKALGAIALYYNEPRMPTVLHQALIEQVTDIASIAIERAQSDLARKQAEEELRRSEAFLAEGQRLSRTGSFSWRVATGEITWSEELYRIFEFEQGLSVTLPLIASRCHPEDAPVFREAVARARDAASPLEYEHRLQMPDGSVKYLRIVAHGTRDPDGQLYIGAVQDVSERRLSEEALSQLRSQMARVARITTLSALTASIAHEVNQPLAGIITNASTCLRMLAADPPNIDGARETARRTIRDGERASNVITRLRTLFGNKAHATDFVDLNDATREVIALSLDELQRNRVTLRTEFADDLPCVVGDRVQLQQVILNLVLNASDAMTGLEDRPRELVISTQREEGERVRLTMKDTGAGFQRQDADKLFEAFYTTKSGGMGIGLSVSRSIVERHQGRLWAVPNDGPGATFAFSLPQAAEEMGNSRDGSSRSLP